MRGRGFTLIELMVAIGLALLLAGLVLGVSMSRLGEASFEEAKGRVGAALATARAEAQRRGVVMEVVARTGAGGTVGMVMEAAPAPGGDAEKAGGSARDDRMGSGSDDASPGRYLEAIELPGGVKIAASAKRANAPAGLEEDGKSGGGSESEKVTVAVFLPDGQGAVGARYLIGKDGRMGEIVLNRWTGTVEVREIVLKADMEGESAVKD